MPAAPLAPFEVFVRPHFHVGGSVVSVLASARLWRVFADRAVETSGLLRAIDDGGFVGSEGDRYRELLHADFPQHLLVTGQAHGGLADALEAYGFDLGARQAEMDSLRAVARVDHAAVNAAVVQVNEAEVAVAVAPDAASKAAAVAALAAAEAQLAAAESKWGADIAAGEEIKASLGGQVAGHAAEISAQARKAFADNPNFLSSAWQAVEDFVHDHAGALSVVSDALQIIGGIMLFIPGLQGLGVVLVGIGVGLKFLLAASGEASWGEFVFDLATCGAVGGVAKLAKAGKLGSGFAAVSQRAAALKNAAGKAADRGLDRVVCALDPVDIATGAMVDNDTDVRIDGTMALVVDRHAFSSHEVGRALGPRWVSRMDVRLEVASDVVTMLCPDGALIQFPPAPADGSEVRADGRGWLLSFGDGAYRVRAVDEAVTYHFRVYEHDEPGSQAVGVADGPASVGRSMVGVGITNGSVAQRFDMGIELGISSMVHRSGHRIDYVWDNASGHMVAMVRSDGTRLDLSWDGAIDRVSGVWVSNPVTHPGDDPVRLVSYGYDPFGRLITVTNSHDGVLRYHYDEAGRPCGWTDRNGVSYVYRFDDKGRVTSQVGTGGFFPNTAVWLDDVAADAPAGGIVAVAVETAAPFVQDPLEAGDAVMDGILDRLDQLELVVALREGGLAHAGLTGRGRAGARDEEGWSVPEAWLHDEVLGDIRPTVYRCTAEGDVWRVVTPEGRVTDFEHNSYHQVTRVVDSAGGVTETTFNADGVATSVTYPDGTGMRAEPGSWGVPVRVVGRDGAVTEYDVDAFGMVTAVREPDGGETRWGWQVRASGIVLESVTNPAGDVTVVECDDAGREVAVVDPAGRRTSWVRDVRGLVVESMDPVGAVTEIGYTPEGWANEVTFADGATQTATFDGEGNQLSSTNELGRTSTVRYTVFDQPVAHTDEAGAQTRIFYNTQMQPVAVTNADGRTWRYEYNLDGEVACEIDYNGRSVNTTTTPDGVRTVIESPAGLTTIQRNRLGQVERVADVSGVTVYDYDAAGRVMNVSNSLTDVSYTYDGVGRLTGETVILASGESTGYCADVDAAGRAAGYSIHLPQGRSVSAVFSHDEFGEVVSSEVSWAESDTGCGRRLAGLSYTRDGRGLRARVGIGALDRHFAYDERGRRVRDHASMPGEGVFDAARVVAGREITWRADTTITEIGDYLRGRSVFAVDKVGRVTAVSRDTTPATTVSSPHSSRQAGGVEESYGFSAAGMLTSYHVTSPAQPHRETSHRASRMDAAIEFDGTQPTRVGRTTYTYDASGRVMRTVTKRISKKPLVRNFYYATGEQPVGFDSSDSPGVGWRYVYDGLGRRVAKETIDTATGQITARTVFVHAGNQLVGEYTTVGDDTGFGWVVSTDPGTGEVIGQVALNPDVSKEAAGDPAGWSQQRVDAAFYAIMVDLAGAPQEIIDPVSGEVVGCAVQTLYGQRTWRGARSIPLLFSGQYLDAESGWAYNRFRFYDPHAGVYNAQDPLGVAARVASAQGYVDHPAFWCDPLGLKKYSQVSDPVLQARIDKLSSNQKGQIGEDITRSMYRGQFPRLSPRGFTYNVGNGRRIPDLTLTTGEIVESKFVKKQGLTKQIQDGVEGAGAGEYILVTAPNTHITRGLQKLIDSGVVVHETMPVSMIEARVP